MNNFAKISNKFIFPMTKSHILFLALAITTTLATFQNVYPGTVNPSIPPTSYNPSFDYVVSQPVNKSLISLDYAATFYSGYIPVDTYGSYIFYHLYPSNGPTDSNANLENKDPIILWMQGGPGCSDWLGAMLENGPFTIINATNGAQIPVLTNVNWNQGYNLLYVDQPPGVGFSPVGTGVNIENSVQAAEYMQTFLEGFFQAYPSLKKNDFYIFGESYGGHYIPALASTLVANKDKNGVNLKGIGIGDGLVNPYYHADAWWQAALSVGIIDTQITQYLQSEAVVAQIQFANGNFSGVAGIFDNIMGLLTDTPMTGVTDIDDYRAQPENTEPPYEFWLQQENMRAAFAVDPSVQYEDCNGEVYQNFANDIGQSFASNITYLLKSGLPVLIYNGQDDMCIPIAGTRGWLDNLEGWTPDKAWTVAGTSIYDDGRKNVIGTFKTYKGLTFVVMNKAGHMVPMYQPTNAKLMVDDFVGGKFKASESPRTVHDESMTVQSKQYNHIWTLQ